MTERELPREGETWRHYKGDLYRIIGIGKQEADNALMVVYKSLKNSEIFIRPVKEFMEGFEDNFVEGLLTGYRFEKTDDSVPSDLALFVHLYARVGFELRSIKKHNSELVSFPHNSLAEFSDTGKFIAFF